MNAKHKVYLEIAVVALVAVMAAKFLGNMIGGAVGAFVKQYI